jgi:Leucine-rich repeat (LRR) protein
MLKKIFATKDPANRMKKKKEEGGPGMTLTRENIQFNQQNQAVASSQRVHPRETQEVKGERNSRQRSEKESDKEAEIPEKGGYLTCLDMPYRHIHVLSTKTNLIHMNIGDHGLLKLTAVLPGNSFIQQIILSNARITSIGFQSLTEILSTLPNLTYLDVSQNAITDSGAEALSMTLSNSKILNETINLERVTLMGNRITKNGANSLVGAVLISKVSYLKSVTTIDIFSELFIVFAKIQSNNKM